MNLLSLPRFLKFNFKKTKIVARSPLASGILSPNYEYNKNFKKMMIEVTGYMVIEKMQ